MEENKSRDISKLSDEELATWLAKEGLNLGGREVLTVSFVFWLQYYVERKIGDIIRGSFKRYIKGNGFSGREDLIDDTLDSFSDELYFGGKINILKDFLMRAWSKNYDDLFSYLWVLNGLRNQIAHGKIEKLTYKDKSLSERHTKELLLSDLLRVLEKAKIS